MKKISRAQFLSSAAPLLTIAGSCRLVAQTRDTPIIISDGSLKMRSAVPWAQFGRPNSRRRVHPSAGKRISTVEVRLAGDNNSTVAYNGEACEVSVTYANLDIVLSTNPNGRNLRIDTDWSAFRDGASAEEIQHSNGNSKISHVVVKRGGTTVVDQRPNGGTQVILHYDD